MQMADYGITVRGTSGLEMAALGKTVITAGTTGMKVAVLRLIPNHKLNIENRCVKFICYQ